MELTSVITKERNVRTSSIRKYLEHLNEINNLKLPNGDEGILEG